jgi:hypothetical protein
VQKYEVGQLPLLPEVTSKKFCEFSHTYDGAVLTPMLVKDPAMIGEEALVPPTTCHEPSLLESLQYTATPVSGSPIADTSASMRLAQLLSVCQLGFGMTALQPLPPLFQAVSAQPRDDEDVFSVVPPTASTPAEVAGYDAPYPLSPADAVMRMPACV